MTNGVAERDIDLVRMGAGEDRQVTPLANVKRSSVMAQKETVRRVERSADDSLARCHLEPGGGETYGRAERRCVDTRTEVRRDRNRDALIDQQPGVRALVAQVDKLGDGQ